MSTRLWIVYAILTTNGAVVQVEASNTISDTRSFLVCFICELVDVSIKCLNNP